MLEFDVSNCRVKAATPSLEKGISNCSLGEIPTGSSKSRLKVDHISKETQVMLCKIAGVTTTDLPPRKCAAYNSFNKMLRMKAVGPLVRQASFENGSDALDAVASACPEFRFDDSPWTCGVLGDTPLHAAAAAGNCSMTSRLLSLQCHKGRFIARIQRTRLYGASRFEKKRSKAKFGECST